MMVRLEKANYSVTIIRSVGLGLMSFSYNGNIGSGFIFIVILETRYRVFKIKVGGW
jgi:hypothetical protein